MKNPAELRGCSVFVVAADQPYNGDIAAQAVVTYGLVKDGNRPLHVLCLSLPVTTGRALVKSQRSTLRRFR
jgi:hypothetical protein